MAAGVSFIQRGGYKITAILSAQATEKLGTGIGLGLEHPAEGGGGSVRSRIHHPASLDAVVGRPDVDGHVLGAEQGLQRQQDLLGQSLQMSP